MVVAEEGGGRGWCLLAVVEIGSLSFLHVFARRRSGLTRIRTSRPVERFVLGGAVARRRSGTTVHLAADGALSEKHDVLSQSTRLVAEDVLDLTQVVGQVPTSSGRPSFCQTRPVHDVVVGPNEVGLEESDEFDGDVEGNGYNVLESDEGVGERDESVDWRNGAASIGVVDPVDSLPGLGNLEGVVDDSTHNTHEREEEKIDQAGKVERCQEGCMK